MAILKGLDTNPTLASRAQLKMLALTSFEVHQTIILAIKTVQKVNLQDESKTFCHQV